MNTNPRLLNHPAVRAEAEDRVKKAQQSTSTLLEAGRKSAEQQIRAVFQLHHRVVEGFAIFVFAVHRPVGVGRAVHAQPAQRVQ